MKTLKYVIMSLVFLAGCGEKEEETAASTTKATLPDGTEVELDANRLYSDGVCEVDNVNTTTYRKSYVSLTEDKFLVWSVVFFNDSCDVAQDHVAFGAPTSFGLLNYDGSAGGIDLEGDQQADYNMVVTDEQLSLEGITGELEDQTFAKESAAFSLDKLFDFSLEVNTPTLTNDNLEVSFTVALLTDDFLVDGVSYLKFVDAEIICRLATGSTVRPKFSSGTSTNRLDGAGTYTATAALLSTQKGVALKSCEVDLESVYEQTASSYRSLIIKSDEIIIE